MNTVAYTAFVAFLSSVLTLVSIHALSSPDATVPGDPDAITREELARHDSAESCWKAIHGAVYDVTGFIADHPTPAAVILEWCGRDASEAWDNKRPGIPHSPRAAGMLDEYLVGRLVGEGGESVAAETSATADQVTDNAEARLSPVADERLHRALLNQPLDGRYRGVFSDSDEMQVNVQFDLRDGRLSNISYRHLAYRGVDYFLLGEGDDLYPVMVQHQQLIEGLEGKPLTTIFALYEPERLVEDIDGYSGATLPGNKVHSAFRDALNRGVYSWP